MKKITAIALVLLTSQVFAWKGATHSRLSQDAIDLLNSMTTDPQAQAAVQKLITRYGSLSAAKTAYGNQAKDEDIPQPNTPLGNDQWYDAWWSYSRNGSPSLFGLVDVSYFVALTHFVNAFNTSPNADVHGQKPMGYQYYRSRPMYNLVGDSSTGDYDWVTEAYNYNLNPTSDTITRMKNLCGGSCRFSTSAYNTDYQDVNQPSGASACAALIDGPSGYVASGNLTLIARCYHYIEDASQPHHAGAYYGKDHTDFEGFVEDNYYNSAYQISQTPAKLAEAKTYYTMFSGMSAENIVKYMAQWSTTNCYAVYTNDYTSNEVACAEKLMPRIRAAVAAMTAQSIARRP
ncbi:MAG TPA: hypothetical protein PKG67_13920 [Turneriella sp.]|nr:hypothetical protein [Turneriella sp.]